MFPNPSPSSQQNTVINPSPLSQNVAFSPNISPLNPVSAYNDPLSNKMLSPSPSLVSPFNNQINYYNHSPLKHGSNPPHRTNMDLYNRDIHPAYRDVMNAGKDSNKSRTEIYEKGRDFSNIEEATVIKSTYIGQELIQDVLHKSSEIFQCLKILQLPSTTNPKVLLLNQERVKKCQEGLKEIVLMIARLNIVYKKCYNAEPHIKDKVLNSFITLIEPQNETSKNIQSNNQKSAVKLHHEDMVKQAKEKNQELFKIMNEVRSIIWEVNTLLSLENEQI